VALNVDWLWRLGRRSSSGKPSGEGHPPSSTILRTGLLDTLSLQFQPATAGLGRRLMSHRDDRRRDIVTALAILACLIVAALLAVFRP
jgi:hypothetical protein